MSCPTICSCPPAALEYGYTPRGKPLVAGAGVEFSIGHTKDYLGIAVSSHPVGLDIECVDPHADYDALAPAVFARDELRRYYDLAAAARPDFLIRTWTEKEALVKATGEGLTHPLSCYEPRQIDAAHKEIAVVAAVAQHRHWFISYIGLVNRHHISVCTPHRRPAIKTIAPSSTARLQQLLFAYR